jgi:predicted secreted protein
MKKILVFGLAIVLLLPLLAVGCSSAKEAGTNGMPNAKTLEITLDDFSGENDKLEYVEIAFPGTLTVRLGGNRTTGYVWEVTEIVHPEVIHEASNDYEEPVTTLVGAGGTEVWVFNTTDTGLAIIRMSYSQPWAGGDKDLYTVTVNVNIR